MKATVQSLLLIAILVYVIPDQIRGLLTVRSAVAHIEPNKIVPAGSSFDSNQAGQVGRTRMKPRMSMITLGVSDLKRSIDFYEVGLGLPKMQSPGEVAFFTLNGTWLGLYSKEALAKDATVSAGGSGFRGVTISHNVSTKAEVDSVLKQAVSAGARLVKPAQEVSWGGYSGYFSDPDGHLWEVAFNPHFWVGPKD
jgi:uncharacterized protein